MANRIERLLNEREALAREAAFRRRLREGKRRHRKQLHLARRERAVLFAAGFREGHLPDEYRFSPLAGLCRDLGDFLQRPLGADHGLYADSLQLVKELLRHPRLAPLLLQKEYRRQIIIILRYGAVVRRIRNWRAPRARDMETTLDSFLSYILMPYPVEVLPSVKSVVLNRTLTQRLRYCSRRQEWRFENHWIDLHFHLAAGGNIRRFYPDLLFPRKTQHYLLQAPRRLSLVQAVHYAVFRAYGIGEAVAQGLSKEVYCIYRLKQYREVLLFIARHPELSLEEASSLCEFYMHQLDGKLYLEDRAIKAMYPAFSFKGRTLASVFRILRSWEAYIRAQLAEGDGTPYPEAAYAGYEEGFYRIRRLRNRAELIEEGWRMQHCVGGYHEECAGGAVSIWSVVRQQGDDLPPKRLATIELRGDRICQVQARCNTAPDAETWKVIRRWMEREGLRRG